MAVTLFQSSVQHRVYLAKHGIVNSALSLDSVCDIAISVFPQSIGISLNFRMALNSSELHFYHAKVHSFITFFNVAA